MSFDDKMCIILVVLGAVVFVLEWLAKKHYW